MIDEYIYVYIYNEYTTKYFSDMAVLITVIVNFRISCSVNLLYVAFMQVA